MVAQWPFPLASRTSLAESYPQLYLYAPESDQTRRKSFVDERAVLEHDLGVTVCLYEFQGDKSASGV
jgi:hypothetical protein